MNKKINLINEFTQSVLVKIFNGGKLDNLPISQEKLGQTTVDSRGKNSILIDVKHKDIISVVGEFPDKSRFLFWSGQALRGNNDIEVTLNEGKFQFKNQPEEYLEELQSQLYSDEDIEFIVERTNSNAIDVFKSHLGGVGIIAVDRTKKTTKPIDLISPDVLNRSEPPKFRKDRVRNFTYILDSKIILKNKLNIPAVIDADFNFDSNKLYSFSYSAVGFGKILYVDPDQKSFEDRWSSLSEITKESFVDSYLSAVSKYRDKEDYEVQVRVYNRGIGFKGMYLKIEEFSKSEMGNGIEASTFFTNGGTYTKSERKEYEDIYGETVLAIGVKGENKTGFIAKLARNRLNKAKSSLSAGKIPDANTIKLLSVNPRVEDNKLDLRVNFGDLDDLIAVIDKEADKHV